MRSCALNVRSNWEGLPDDVTGHAIVNTLDAARKMSNLSDTGVTVPAAGLPNSSLDGELNWMEGRTLVDDL